MSATRLLVLGMLDTRGPMHGHQIRRQAELINIENWGDVKIGGLYGALHRMEAEDLIRPVRTERAGRYPARTVYAITDEGRTELHILREKAFQEAHLTPDPFDVALTTADLSSEDFVLQLGQRRRMLAVQLDQLIMRREGLMVEKALSHRFQSVFRHWELRLEAEITFLDELTARLPLLIAESLPAADTSADVGDDRPGEPAHRPDGSGATTPVPLDVQRARAGRQRSRERGGETRA
jgi:DNA-binding PadR family transcriptional regulator